MDMTSSPVRPWVRDGMNGTVWMTDDQALDRLTRGQGWVPADGTIADLLERIAAELAA